ncbi:hypothetical protein EDB89DRAFT_2026019 [Lactarius sanguifluus]|nr:hypothetical protein EDB89DRAFT_2026019 [Lactarius sanguifluus]
MPFFYGIDYADLLRLLQPLKSLWEGPTHPSQPRLSSRDPHLRLRSASRFRPLSLRYNNTPASLQHSLITYNACTLLWSRLSKCNGPPQPTVFSAPSTFCAARRQSLPSPLLPAPHETCPREANQRLAKTDLSLVLQPQARLVAPWTTFVSLLANINTSSIYTFQLQSILVLSLRASELCRTQFPSFAASSSVPHHRAPLETSERSVYPSKRTPI